MLRALVAPEICLLSAETECYSCASLGEGFLEEITPG